MRPCRPGDEGALVDLFGRVFGRELTEERWRWKLASRPSPVPNVWVAEAGGRLVFQYAGIPFRLRAAGREVRAMLAVDGMTDPAWRRRGLLTEGVGRAHEAWREAGIALVLGLPNERWGGRTEALSWQPLFPLEWRARPLRPERTLARRLGAPAVARLSAPGAALHALLRLRGRRAETALAERDTTSAAFDALDASAAAGIPFGPVHDGSWVRWRLLEAVPEPYRVALFESKGEITGWAAFRVVAGTAHLADLRADPRDIPPLLNLLADALRADGVEKILTLTAPGTALQQALRRAGYLRVRRPFLLHAVLLDPSLPLERLRDPGSWLLTGADFDVL